MSPCTERTLRTPLSFAITGVRRGMGHAWRSGDICSSLLIWMLLSRFFYHSCPYRQLQRWDTVTKFIPIPFLAPFHSLQTQVNLLTLPLGGGRCKYLANKAIIRFHYNPSRELRPTFNLVIVNIIPLQQGDRLGTESSGGRLVTTRMPKHTRIQRVLMEKIVWNSVSIHARKTPATYGYL